MTPINLELENIFGSAWIYVGHESQVKNAGDFFATRIGKKPLLLVRDASGKIQLLHNQCAHRGSLVVAAGEGVTDALKPAIVALASPSPSRSR